MNRKPQSKLILSICRMNKSDSILKEIPGYLVGFCSRKDIDVVDKDVFVLDDRRKIFNYHILTGDYAGIVKNIFRGEATLNENQLIEYQRKDFARSNEKFSVEGFLYTDID